MDAALKIRRPLPTRYNGSEDVGFFETDRDVAWVSHLGQTFRTIHTDNVDPIKPHHRVANLAPAADLWVWHNSSSPTHVFHTFQSADPAVLHRPVLGFVHATDISTQKKSYAAHVFDAIQAFCVSPNRPRDRLIADRLINLHRDVLAEGEQILTSSLSQFVRFFLDHPDLALPKITMTPDGMLRARWISGANSFVAVEFTGHQLVKLVAEIPRANGQTASYFGSEMLANIVPFSRALGASFG
jgi:hypothetical protein